MRGDHRHHERLLEEAAEVALAKARFDELVDRSDEAIRRLLAARTQRTQPLALLCDVHQVTLERVRARDRLELVLVERLDE